MTGAGPARLVLTPLPSIDFERPPVVETVLGVQFAPLKSLTVAHLGLFWGEVRREYPQHEIQPPLPHEVEEFPRKPGGTIALELTSEHEARCWFVDAMSTQLIQVQRDRFVRNWRKRPAPDDAYPRYATLRPRFEEDWSRFVSFLEREDLGQPNVDQCEVTYVNLIELGPGRSSLGDLDDMFTIFRRPPERTFLPEPEALIFNALYPMPNRTGRLHVWGQPAIRRTDGAEVVQLRLTARGTPRSSRLEDIREWFDLGHAWVVHGFTDLATPTMLRAWGQR